jgi:hypothetical protein
VIDATKPPGWHRSHGAKHATDVGQYAAQHTMWRRQAREVLSQKEWRAAAALNAGGSSRSMRRAW